MKIALYTQIVSPHQLPLAEAYRRLYPEDRFDYIYTLELPPDATKRGWEWHEKKDWIIDYKADKARAEKVLRDADCVLSTHRDLDVFEERCAKGRPTLYASERWFKPLHGITGRVRMLVPSYRKMAKRFVRWIKADKKSRILAVGPWAKKDFQSIGVAESKMLDWGYFVGGEPGAIKRKRVDGRITLLWVGRMLDWKRVDTIVKAVALLTRNGIEVALTIVGQGPEERRLKKMAQGLPIEFKEGLPIEKVREVMQSHDVYVLSSDGGEGWGVALQEALLEGMVGIGTFEAGSSAAILPDECLYHAGDAKGLSDLIIRAMGEGLPRPDMTGWTTDSAAARLHRMAEEACNG